MTAKQIRDCIAQPDIVAAGAQVRDGALFIGAVKARGDEKSYRSQLRIITLKRCLL